MPEDHLKISIIVPSFNQGHFIEETLLSILNQSYTNVEIILIDGGSVDNTLSVIKKYESKLTFWLSEKDSGQSEAINKGLKAATGDIITWLNSDDLYEKNTLRLVADMFTSDESIQLLHGKTLLFGEKINTQLIGPDKDLESHEYLPYMRFPQPSSFFRKSALEKIMPVNNNLHYAMDFELVVKLILMNFKAKRVSDLFSRYRMHKTSKSNNDLAFLHDWSEVFINVLRSIPGGETYISQLNDLDIRSKKAGSIYPNFICLSDQLVENIFLTHLDLHFHHHYRAFNYADCKKISDFMKKSYFQFYTHKQYKKFMFRLKFVPKFIVSLVRNF